MSQKKIVLVGGGTGGHFYPLIAIAEALYDADSSVDIYYIGPKKYDTQALIDIRAKFSYMPAGKRRRYFSPLNILDFFKNIVGVILAIIHLYRIYPDVVVSKGGYTSLPVVVAAFLLRIPIVVHESDAKIGGANKLGLRLAREFIINYEEVLEQTSIKNEHVHVFGIPVRKSQLAAPSQDALAKLGIESTVPLILVIGGSLGADRINQFIINALNEILPDYSVLHQTGPKNFESVQSTVNNLIVDETLRSRYHPVPFLDQKTLNDVYHLSQVIISRAGSTSIYEIALHGKPSILIPIPETISHDQRTNAYTYARSGAAMVIEEENVSDNLLRAEIDRIMNEQGVYESMAVAAESFGRSDAAQRTAGLILEIAQEHDR